MAIAAAGPLAVVLASWAALVLVAAQFLAAILLA